MKRARRRVVGFLGVTAFVFAQFTLSAYACPDLARMVGSSPASSSSSHCEEMDESLPALCQKHCLDEKQKPNDAFSSAASIAFVASFSTRLQLVKTSIEEFVFARSLLDASPPPLTVRNCCFRI